MEEEIKFKDIRLKRFDLFFGLFGIFVTSLFLLGTCNSEREELPREELPREELPREELPREELIKKQFSVWDGSNYYLVRFIKKAMNDPDSYEHDETVYWDKGDHLVVKMTYRGKNAFGATVRNFVKAKVSLNGQILEIIDQT